jgi:NAD(P) transhydrogenase subunit beta
MDRLAAPGQGAGYGRLAMNRSLLNILAGNFGAAADQGAQAIKGRLKPVDASDAGTAMRYASSIIHRAG